MKSESVTACDAVEAGAVRRFAQATMDERAVYGEAGADSRYGAPVAPPLYPALMFRRPLGMPDPVQTHADDPDWDGNAAAGTAGLPPIEPLRDHSVLNGGAEVELFRYARHGERVSMQSRYENIYEKEGRKGPMVLVIVASEYRTLDSELLLRVRRTYIWSRT
jgi:hydroxyacyl-ACP dehydratase HTD2-like protein with hotdog domain